MFMTFWLLQSLKSRPAPTIDKARAVAKPAETGTVLVTGVFILKSDSMTTFKIGVGENVCVAPLIDVDINWYINGTLVREIRKSGTRTYHNAQNMWVREVGYVLREQGMSEVQVAYVKYTGSAPPNGWFDTAQTKAKADGITAIN